MSTRKYIIVLTFITGCLMFAGCETEEDRVENRRQELYKGISEELAYLERGRSAWLAKHDPNSLLFKEMMRRFDYFIPLDREAVKQLTCDPFRQSPFITGVTIDEAAGKYSHMLELLGFSLVHDLAGLKFTISKADKDTEVNIPLNTSGENAHSFGIHIFLEKQENSIVATQADTYDVFEDRDTYTDLNVPLSGITVNDLSERLFVMAYDTNGNISNTVKVFKRRPLAALTQTDVNEPQEKKSD